MSRHPPRPPRKTIGDTDVLDIVRDLRRLRARAAAIIERNDDGGVGVVPVSNELEYARRVFAKCDAMLLAFNTTTGAALPVAGVAPREGR